MDFYSVLGVSQHASHEEVSSMLPPACCLSWAHMLTSRCCACPAD